MNTLENNKTKPLFEVPDHYFEQMQHDVMQKVMQEEKRRKTSKTWISAISAAASIAIIVLLSVYLVINRNTEEHFYVYEEIIPTDDTLITLESNHLAEVINELTEEISEPLSLQAPLVAINNKETIVFRAMDFYVDDYEIDSFCEVMYDLECYYDY